MLDQYILDDKHNAIPEPDYSTWVKWFETADRRVALTQIGPYYVSTVFIGLNFGTSPPLLFETMVWKDDDTGFNDQERCSTWDEAIAQHKEVCARFEAQEPSS